ncbi:MAG: 6-carboxytetrahydropterin synthase [Desulfomonilaceae bacterium]|nr:6-carboxytetrahydropterin synthase [Desulfomonilaceae bacterium]
MSTVGHPSLYRVAVQRNFIARHYLVGGNWGVENQLHAHHYDVELILEGEMLDRHGYLVDIADVETALEEIVGRFKDKVLNELPEFEGLNPSIENFSRILWHGMADRINAPNLGAMQVKIWENEIAWASFRRDLR